MASCIGITVTVLPPECETNPCAEGCPDSTECGKCGNDPCTEPSNLGGLIAMLGIGLLGGLVLMSSGKGSGMSGLSSDSGGLPPRSDQ